MVEIGVTEIPVKYVDTFITFRTYMFAAFSNRNVAWNSDDINHCFDKRARARRIMTLSRDQPSLTTLDFHAEHLHRSGSHVRQLVSAP